jgi:hypothetical protein
VSQRSQSQCTGQWVHPVVGDSMHVQTGGAPQEEAGKGNRIVTHQPLRKGAGARPHICSEIETVYLLSPLADRPSEQVLPAPWVLVTGELIWVAGPDSVHRGKIWVIIQIPNTKYGRNIIKRTRSQNRSSKSQSVQNSGPDNYVPEMVPIATSDRKHNWHPPVQQWRCCRHRLVHIGNARRR